MVLKLDSQSSGACSKLQLSFDAEKPACMWHHFSTTKFSPPLPPNPDLSSSRAFKLQHLRPGTLSLSLTENDEDPLVQAGAGYRNVQFLITTGPVLTMEGEATAMSSKELHMQKRPRTVAGRSCYAMRFLPDALLSLPAKSLVPTFKPSDNARQLNVFAQS
eukprot:1148151-Pelagomonas_calceolata.AAC.3